MNGFLLDTHAWFWIQTGDSSKVSTGFFPEVERWQKRGIVYISGISVLELARLSADGTLDLGSSIDKFVLDATRDGGFQILSLTTQVLIESTRLPGQIHRDPSDRMLVATAREHGLTLVTRDKPLLEYADQGHLKARKP
jgi:PIN domain nuclease of toxin-antitoxin system